MWVRLGLSSSLIKSILQIELVSGPVGPPPHIQDTGTHLPCKKQKGRIEKSPLFTNTRTSNLHCLISRVRDINTSLLLSMHTGVHQRYKFQLVFHKHTVISWWMMLNFFRNILLSALVIQLLFMSTYIE